MKTIGSRACLLIAIVLLTLNSGLASQPNKRAPPISVEQAISLAKNHVKERKIDVSKRYIASATLNVNPRDDRGPSWLITWEPNTNYSSVLKTAGGQVVATVHMNRQIEVRFGE